MMVARQDLRCVTGGNRIFWTWAEIYQKASSEAEREDILGRIRQLSNGKTRQQVLALMDAALNAVK